METVTLGRTGLKVGKLSLGGLFVAGFATELEEARRAVSRAVDLGVNYIDTAPGYHNSEEVLGQCLKGVDKPVILSTKLGGRPKPFDPRNPAQLMESVKESLRLLGREVIDILMIHEPDRPGQYDWWTDWHALQGPVLGVLDELKKQGVIRFTGLGGTTVSELAFLCRTGKFDVVLTAYNYSLLYRESASEVMPAARSQNMGVVIGSPLQQGLFARCFDEAVADPGVYWLSQARRGQLKALYALSREAGLPLPEMGLRFILSQPLADCVLMGARSAREVEQNVAAVEKGPLPPDVLRALDAIAALVPSRPFGEPFGIGWFMPNPRGYRGMGVA
jgi:aryl-alcohol dehydrogenase-like predicted oxidoreductase